MYFFSFSSRSSAAVKIGTAGWAADTAAALPQERERCLRAGMNDFVAKPAKMAALRAALAPYARAGGGRG